MQICVSGWYFERDLFEVFKVNKQFDISVVTYYNRANGNIKRDYDEIPVPEMISSYVKESGVKHYKIPVAGLEFGGYDYFIKNIWDQQSPVLFMHDDIVIYNPNVFDIIKEKLAKWEYDQTFIFRDEVEEISQGRIHGRGIYCSKRFIDFMLSYTCECKQAFDYENPHYEGFKPKAILEGTGPHRGFWYDPYNLGEHTRGQPPKHIRHYNDGIYHFANFAGRTSYKSPWPEFPKQKVRTAVHFPDFNSAHRGEWTGQIYGRGKELKECSEN
jgi:hypothetical protein